MAGVGQTPKTFHLTPLLGEQGPDLVLSPSSQKRWHKPLQRASREWLWLCGPSGLGSHGFSRPVGLQSGHRRRAGAGDTSLWALRCTFHIIFMLYKPFFFDSSPPPPFFRKFHLLERESEHEQRESHRERASRPGAPPPQFQV